MVTEIGRTKDKLNPSQTECFLAVSDRSLCEPISIAGATENQCSECSLINVAMMMAGRITERWSDAVGPGGHAAFPSINRLHKEVSDRTGGWVGWWEETRCDGTLSCVSFPLGNSAVFLSHLIRSLRRRCSFLREWLGRRLCIRY